MIKQPYYQVMLLLLVSLFATKIFASTENINLFLKDFDMNEIVKNHSLCKNYLSLYKELENQEKEKYEFIACPRKDDSESIDRGSKYLSDVEKEINVIKKTNKEFEDRIVEIVVNQKL